jgi:hypothetical protein
VVDSGAGVHVTPKRDFIRNLRPLRSPVRLNGVFGQPEEATHFGEGEIAIGSFTLNLAEVLYMPTIKDTLLSFVRLIREGHQIAFNSDGGVFVDKEETVRLPLHGTDNILTLGDVKGSPPRPTFAMNAVTRSAAAPVLKPPLGETPGVSGVATDDVRIAHARYGHLCARKLVQLAKSGTILLDSSSLTRLTHGNKTKVNLYERSCDACELGKMARQKFATQFDHLAERPNDKVVADICGPIWTVTNEDKSTSKYYLSTITDVYSRHLEVLIIDSKDAASDHCISYFHRAKITTQNDMKHFHTDGGTEYNKFEKVAQSRGTKVTRTPVHTPQRNGIAERKNRTVTEMTRALLLHANLSLAKYWRYAIETAVTIHNRCTIVGKLGKTIHELYTGHAPDLSHLRVFGCDAFVRIPNPQSKLAPRSEKGVFVGYDIKREFCYRILVGDTIVISRDVEFVENSFTVGRKPSDDAPTASRNAQNDRSDDAGVVTTRTGNFAAEILEFGGDADPASMDNPHRSSTPTAASVAERKPVRSDVDTSLTDVQSTEIDKRTRKRLATAMAHEATRATPSNNCNRSKRTRTQARRTGLNPDDFGHAAFAVSVSPSPVESSLLSNISPQETSSSTAEHSPATIPQTKIRVTDVPIPATAKAAMKSPFASYWRAAMDAEHASIVQHNVFELVPVPSPVPNIVTSRWVFAVKEKDGFVVRFKARLVARGFTQQQGVDFEETYSPVMKYKTLRILLTLVVQYGWRLEIMDVQTAYLHADLTDTVYMQQPDGLEQLDTQRENGRDVRQRLVWLLRKALYGLKQAGREWNILLDKFVRSLGFTRCISDTCLYVKTSLTGRPLLLSVYVDDIPSAYAIEDSNEWGEITAAFFDRFKIAFQPEADWILNMRITRDPSGFRLLLDQQAYIEQILEDFGMDECKPASNPAAQERLLTTPTDGVPLPSFEPLARSLPMQTQGEPFNYRRAIGLLMYLANTSRPDIAHPVNFAARFVQYPGPSHVRAVRQIFRYISGTRHYGLLFQRQDNADQPLSLIGYADADWGGCTETGRSTTGALITLGGCVIDWSSKRQTTVALSSCEAEYMAVAATLQSLMWLQQMLGEIGFIEHTVTHTSPNSPRAALTASSLVTRTPELFNDNRSAIAMSHNDVHHQRSKHISLRYHFVREAVAARKIRLEWCSTREQLADILTKSLAPSLYTRIRDVLVYTRESVLKTDQNRRS